jgi:hypothetical protein
MIETFMLFSLGFLTASLLTLIVVPFVHNRAERLTMRRIVASIPASIVEVHASKDQLRAEFAMSTRRLELSIEQLTAKTASLVVELGKKTAVINRLKVELDGKTAATLTSKRRETPSPREINPDFSVKTDWIPEGQYTLPEREAAKLNTELDDRSRTADAQRIEIVALKIQNDALKDQLAGLGKHRAQEQIDPERRRAILRLVG